MDKDEDLFAYARRSDPQTSHDAAARVQRIRESQQKILDALVLHGPMTDEQIAGCDLGMSPSGTLTRRKELVDKGKVFDTGQTKLTKANRKTIVWDIVKSPLLP